MQEDDYSQSRTHFAVYAATRMTMNMPWLTLMILPIHVMGFTLSRPHNTHTIRYHSASPVLSFCTHLPEWPTADRQPEAVHTPSG